MKAIDPVIGLAKIIAARDSNEPDHQSNVSENKMVDFVFNKMNDQETWMLRGRNGLFAREVKVST